MPTYLTQELRLRVEVTCSRGPSRQGLVLGSFPHLAAVELVGLVPGKLSLSPCLCSQCHAVPPTPLTPCDTRAAVCVVLCAPKWPTSLRKAVTWSFLFVAVSWHLAQVWYGAGTTDVY